MSNTTQNTDLIPKDQLAIWKQGLDLLDQYDDKIMALLAPISEWNAKLAKNTLSLKEQAQVIKEITAAEGRYNTLTKERETVLKSLEKWQSKKLANDSEEAKKIQEIKVQIQQQNKEYREQAKAALELAKAKEQDAKATQEQANASKAAAETPFEVERYRPLENKEEQAERIRQLHEERDAIMEASRAARDADSVYNQSAESKKTDTQQTKELTDAERYAANAFAETSEEAQTQIRFLVELENEIAALKKERKDLDVQYKNGAIIHDEYIQRKAELIALEQQQTAIAKDVKATIESETVATVKYDSSVGDLTKTISVLDRRTGTLITRILNVTGVKKAWLAVNNQLVKSFKMSAQAASVTMFAAIGVLIGGAMLAINAFKRWREEQEKIAQLQSDFIRPIIQERTEVTLLFNALKNTTEGTKEYENVRDRIIKQYKDILKDQDEDIRQLRNIEGAYKAITAAVSETAIQRGLEQATKKQAEEFADSWDDNLRKVEKSFIKVFGEEEGLRQVALLNEELIRSGGELTDEAKKIAEGVSSELGSVFTLLGGSGDKLTFNLYLQNFARIYSGLEKGQQRINAYASAFRTEVNQTSSLIDIELKKLDELDLKYGTITDEKTLAQYNREKKAIEDNISRLRSLGIMDDKTRKGILKNLEAELKAMQALEELKISNNAQELKRISDDDKKFYEDRLMAFNAYTEEMRNSIETSSANQIDSLVKPFTDAGMSREQAEQQVWNQILLIRAKTQIELDKIDRDGEEGRLALLEGYLQKKIDTISKYAEQEGGRISQTESADLAELARQYAKGIVNAEQYQARRTEITRKAANDRFDAEVNALKEALNLANLTEEQQLALEEQIGKSRIDYEKYVNDQIISDEEDAAKRREEIEQALADKRKEIISEMFSFISAMMVRATDSQLAGIDKEQEATEKHYDELRDKTERLYEAGAISKEEADARKRAADDAEEARMEELEQKRKEIQTRQAQFEKASAISQIIIQTALAIAKALPNLVLAATVGALGAAQLATAIATPIPNYAEGTEGQQGHKGGWAVVGDGGRPEMIVSPRGQTFKTPSIPTLMDLPKGSIVYPDWNLALQEMHAMAAVKRLPERGPEVRVDFNTEDIIESNQEVTKAVNTFMAKYQRGTKKMHSENVKNNLKQPIRR